MYSINWSVQYSDLYTDQPNAGTLLIYEPVEVHDDKQFYNACCSRDGHGCNLFYERQAQNTCEQYIPLYCYMVSLHQSVFLHVNNSPPTFVTFSAYGVGGLH